jgi:hypothetical protein
MAPEIARFIGELARYRSNKAPADAWQDLRLVADALFLRRFGAEYLEGMKGIADGAAAAGARWDGRPIDLIDVVTINADVETNFLENALEATANGLEGRQFDLTTLEARTPLFFGPAGDFQLDPEFKTRYQVLDFPGGGVLVGGSFETGGPLATALRLHDIGVLNGSTWSTLGQGVTSGENGRGFGLALAHGPAGEYVGGSFDQVGPVQTRGIALWDGSAWHVVFAPNDGHAGILWGVSCVAAACQQAAGSSVGSTCRGAGCPDGVPKR